MATSFAAYASQYLNRQMQGASSASSSSQPMFFSFTTDEGSRVGREDLRDRDLDMDDEGDPHLRHSDEIHHIPSARLDDDEDPYLRLDEDDGPLDETSRRRMDNLPLISPESSPSEDEHRHGWLVHQTMYTTRNPSPRSSSDSSTSSSPPPAYLQTGDTIPVHPQSSMGRRVDLTESLLPRDGQSRPVDIFSLPDPRRLGLGRRIYKDSIWTSLWCFSISACYIASIIILFTTSKPTTPKGTILPYTTLIHTIPLITILTFVTAIVSYAHILLLRMFVQPVLFATSVFVPVALFISSLWAFIGSFMWEEGSEPTWGETVGLRLFAIIPLILGLITSRRLLTLPQEIRTTSAVLALATKTLMLNPFLLALSPFTLLVSLIASIPFLTLIFRLTLIGYALNPFPKRTAWEWHVSEWAGWAITGTIFVWLWSWAVARGVLRMTCSAVIGAWYFHPHHLEQPPPMSTYRIHAALYRAGNASLGTVVVSALLLAGVRFLGLLTTLLRRAPVPLLPWLSLPLSILGNATNSLSTYALAYAGLTGDSFFPSARRARALAAATQGVRNRFRGSGRDSSLAILTITPLTLTLPFALIAYLFVAHTLSAPDYAAGAALLAGGVTALVGLFCVGLVEDAADALYMCYCIDRDIGQVHQPTVFEAFEGRLNPPPEVVPIPEPDVARPFNPPISPIHKSHRSVIVEQSPDINSEGSEAQIPIHHPSLPVTHPESNSYTSSSSQQTMNPAITASHVSMSRSAGLSDALSEDSQILPGSDFFA